MLFPSIFLFIGLAASVPLNFQEEWAAFKIKFKKTYNSPFEELNRLKIFQNNLAAIEEHNQKFAEKKETWTKGINQFTDWTKEEINAFLNRGKILQPEIFFGSLMNDSSSCSIFPGGVDLPAHVDWRTKNAVTRVKNQGSCGSCWSFGATGAIEGQLALQKNKLISLSEQQLVDCSAPFNNQGCQGGYPHWAFDYIQQYGIQAEHSYPYSGRENACRHNPSEAVTGLSGYCFTNSGDERSLQHAVATIGPIAAGVYMEASELIAYGGNIGRCRGTPSYITHAVTIVGYGTENGQDYWLIKNSWGEDWGEKGYFKLARNAGNTCLIASYDVFPLLM